MWKDNDASTYVNSVRESVQAGEQENRGQVVLGEKETVHRPLVQLSGQLVCKHNKNVMWCRTSWAIPSHMQQGIFYMHQPTDRIAHAMAVVIPVM